MPEKKHLDNPDFLDNLVRIHTDELKRVMTAYRRIRRENNLDYDDLIRGNRALDTNVKLLDDAMTLQTDVLTASGDREALKTHFKAKEAFLLWCMIYCEKFLFSRMHSKREQTAVFEGTVDGVMDQYNIIRDKLRQYFELPEKERLKIYKGIPVRGFMLQLANNRKKTNFSSTCRQTKNRIPKKIVDRYRHRGLDIIEEYKRFGIQVSRFVKEELFIGNEKIPARVVREYAKKELDIIKEKRKEGITVERRIREEFFIDNALVPIQTGDDGEINFPGSIDLIERTRKEMNAYTIVREMEKILAYVSQSDDFSELEEEFIYDCLYTSKISYADKHRQWVEKGIEGVPTYEDDRKYIYRFKQEVINKLIAVMIRKNTFGLLRDCLKSLK